MKTAVKTTIGVLAAEALETCMQKAEKYESAVKKHKDAEDLHQMRVQLRRLRTAMQVFAPSLRLPKAAGEAQVAKVAKRLGKLRDLDVIVSKLRDNFAPDLPEPERQTLDRVINALVRRQKKARKQVKKELNGDRYNTLKSALYQWSASPDCNATARLSIQAVLPDLLLPLISQLWLHPGWLVGTKVTQKSFKPDTRMSHDMIDVVATDQSKTLHSLRKQVKRVRYQFKFVSEYYGDRLEASLKRLADLQDTLGELQDCLVLGNFLTKLLPGWQAQLPTLKSLLSDRRHTAWQQWQKQQAYFLQPSNRDALRQLLLAPEGEGTETATPKTPAKRTEKKAVGKTATKSTSRTTRKRKSSQSTQANNSSRSSSKATKTDADGAS